MNRDDIIRMAEEASGGRQPEGWGVMLDHEQLERFANIVAAAEREACAKVCEKMKVGKSSMRMHQDYLDGVRRGISQCAFVIRERGAP